jgi:hypothetical protein
MNATIANQIVKKHITNNSNSARYSDQTGQILTAQLPPEFTTTAFARNPS